MNRFRNIAGISAAVFSLVSFASCDLDDIAKNGDGSTCSWGNAVTDLFDLATGADCAQTAADYQTFVAKQGSLLTLDTVESRMKRFPKDYSMALVLNADAVNKLFRASAEWSFGGVDVGLPTIQIGGCRPSANYSNAAIQSDNCLSFDFAISVGGYGFSVNLGVPVTTEIKGKDGSDEKGLRTAIYADLENFQLLDASIKSGGSSGNLGILGSTIITTVLQPVLKQYLSRVFLFDISAWKMGNGNIRLLAGGPVTNDAEGTLTLGMYSNIDLGIPDDSLGETARVTWEESFPEDAEVGIHVHPDLIRGILSLMFSESYIEDELTLDTASASASAPSAFEVTMADMTEYPMQTLMTCGEEWQKYFTVGLRLWSTQNVCGYFDLLAGFNVNVTTSKFEIGVGNIRAGKAKGIGALAKIGLNAITNTQTFQDLMKQATLSFNYDQFTVPTEKGSEQATQQVATDAVDFRVDGNGISLYLNFLDL